MRPGAWFRQRAWGLIVGAAVTICAVAAYLGGALDWGVRQWLDVNFRYVNRVPASDRILLIDINDYAVERIHRWPWPRRLHAELITTLKELGAEAILMDIVFAEPMTPRLEDPRLHRDYDVDAPSEIHGSLSPDDAIFDDDEFAAALAAAGNVYLAMYYRHLPPDQPLEQLKQQSEEVFAADPAADPQTFRQALPFDPGPDYDWLYDHFRMRRLLLQDFGLSREDMSQRLNAPTEVLDRHFGRVKRLVARELVADILAENPLATWEQVHARALPGAALDSLSADREDILRAYRSALAEEMAVRQQPRVPEALRGRLEQGWNLTCPLDKFARAARGIGFVTFETDPDGVLRRIPLVIDAHGHLVKQLGFAVVCDLLGLDAAQARRDGDVLVVAGGAGGSELRIPIDSDGRTLLNWHIDVTQPVWQRSFNHLPVSAVMELVANRQAIEENQARQALKRAQLVEAVTGARSASYGQYAADVRRSNAIRRRLRYGTGGEPAESEALKAELAACRQRVEANETQALEFARLTVDQLRELSDRSPDEEQVLLRLDTLLTELTDQSVLDELDRLNAGLRNRNAELGRQLGERIRGKACFVGYTAAAVADTVNSPVFQNMPGVLAHANVVNTILQYRFPWTAPRWLNVLLLVLSGTAVTLVTASRGPWVSLIAVLVLVPLILAGACVLFGLRVVYLAAVVPAMTVFVCWAFITLYRQLVEQRAKRQFSKALAQYTSPAVAAQIAEDAELQDLTPCPVEVTCFFSDLRGFTAISERLGAARTREILNPYLEVMSEVLIAHRAIINKFMGDGIFAFFNPPILACPDHARAACNAAIESLAALERLKERYAGGAMAADVAALEMRIGINSGTVFVGDYGSVNKLDYTCIGDAVNLAARLEPANKVFGTRIMVSDPTRARLDEGFALRPLGRLQVVGKQQALPVYELMGSAGAVDGERLRYAEAFGRIVDAYQHRRWDDALACLDSCAALRPDDPAQVLYRTQIERFRESPPPPDWNRGIELTGK